MVEEHAGKVQHTVQDAVRKLKHAVTAKIEKRAPRSQRVQLDDAVAETPLRRGY